MVVRPTVSYDKRMRETQIRNDDYEDSEYLEEEDSRTQFDPKNFDFPIDDLHKRNSKIVASRQSFAAAHSTSPMQAFANMQEKKKPKLRDILAKNKLPKKDALSSLGYTKTTRDLLR